MNEPAEKPGATVSPEQARYARRLDLGMRAGLAWLIATFALYVAGVLPVEVPFESLPRLWTLPAGEYLEAAGVEPGWGWVAHVGKGDFLALTGIALLAVISLPCLAELIPTYAGRGDRVYVAVVAALIAVLVAAASGVIGGH